MVVFFSIILTVELVNEVLELLYVVFSVFLRIFFGGLYIVFGLVDIIV